MIYENEMIRLVALTPEQLHALDEQPAALLRELGVVNAKFFNPPKLRGSTRTFFLPRMTGTPPEDYFLYTRWLAIEKSSRRIVAELLIKQGPDGEGGVEIGYGVYPDVEGRGFMTATVACFLEWARTETRIKRVWAETRRENIGSIRVLEKNGFKRVKATEKFYYWETPVNPI